MDYPCSISLSFNSRICTIYLPLLPLKRKRYVFLKFEVHKIKGSKNWKKNPCKTICIQNGKYEAIKWPQNYSWKNVNVCVFWWYVMIGICRWGNISFHKIQRYYGLYSRDLTWFESKIIPALYPILIYSDIPLGKHL